MFPTFDSIGNNGSSGVRLELNYHNAFDWERPRPGSGLLGVGMANFQGVKSFQAVPIAPLTLLYGPNSAGKSTIADALELFECLTQGTGDAKSLLARWSRRASAKDALTSAETPLVISIYCAPWWGGMGDWCKKNFSSFTFDYFEEVNSRWLEVFFNGQRPGDQPCIPFVYSITILEGKIASIAVTIASMLFAEVKFSGMNPKYEYVRYWDSAHIRFSNTHPFYKEMRDRFPVNFEKALEGIAAGGVLELSEKHTSIELSYREDKGLSETLFVWEDLKVDPRDDESIPTDSPANVLAKSFVTFLVSGLADMAGRCCSHASVPPIRRIPSAAEAEFELEADRFFRDGYTHSGSKSDEMTFWRHLAESAANGTSLFERVSEVLRSESALDTGYRLGFQLHHIVDDGMLHATPGKRRASAKELIASSRKRVRIFLRDRNDNELRFDDVGAGVSQILPVVIAIHSVRSNFYVSMVYLHQPELHLHPRIQAQLGDVLLECINGSEHHPDVIFVESHSEHLLLRLLKRVRLTSFNPSTPPSRHLTPDQLSVVYVDRNEEKGTTFKRLRVSQSGEFLDLWPKGFFTEREAELFDKPLLGDE